MPKFNYSLIISMIFLASCGQGSDSGGESLSAAEVTDLQNRMKQLELDNSLKDSVINESLLFFNEIQSNLEAIGIRRTEIQNLTSDPEFSADDKVWVLRQIRQINFLRDDNADKINQLNKELSKNKFKIVELETMIESLMKDVQWKDEQINMLQAELERMDVEYSKLFDAYQEQAVKIENLTVDLNSVHYAVGTVAELSKNGVIEKKNGFIGLGKKYDIKDQLNDKYFTKISAKDKKVLSIDGNNPRFITPHPSASYTIVTENGRSKLTITDVSEFWKVSKYLVIVVD